jgi:hypothetical protein
MRNIVSIFLFAIAALATACSESPGEFSAKLGKAVRSGNVSEVDLATFIPIQWDELYIFRPYSLREESCKTLGLGWLQCNIALPTGINEHEDFLVFRLRSKIVHTEHHWGKNGVFTSQTRMPQPVLRSSAKFEIKLVSERAADGTQLFRLEHLVAPKR